MYEKDWTKKVEYKTIFTSLTHHKIENKPTTDVYLAEQYASGPVNPEQTRYQILKNSDDLQRLPKRSNFRPISAMRTPLKRPKFDIPSMLDRDQDFYSLTNLFYRKLKAKFEEKERIKNF